MKRNILFFFCLSLILFILPGCTPSTKQNGSVELAIFAAASMTESMTEIGTAYNKDYPNVTLLYNFDSSGTLKTQLEEGALCDIFISAGQKQMDQLDINADPKINTNSLDFIYTESRFNLLENKVSLAVPEGNPAVIDSFHDLVNPEKTSFLLAVGNSDVPVGQYSQKIFSFLGIDENDLIEKGHITYGSNVKEIATQIAESTVDCGIIYATDAHASELTVVDTATVEMCGQAIYPVAIIKTSTQVDEAQKFLEYLTGPTATSIFTSSGFTPIL